MTDLYIKDDSAVFEQRRAIVFDIMLRARTLIDNPACWCQWSEHKRRGEWDAYCAIGSVREACRLAGKPAMYPIIIDMLDWKAQDLLGWSVSGIVGLNDSRADSHKQVIEVFDWFIDQLSQIVSPPTVMDDKAEDDQPLLEPPVASPVPQLHARLLLPTGEWCMVPDEVEA